MNRKNTSIIIAFLLLATNLSCQIQQPADPDQNKIQIVTTFYPLWFLTDQIANRAAQVSNLARSRDIHEYEPSPQDLVQIEQADLFIFQSEQLESWTADIIPDLEDQGIETLEMMPALDLIDQGSDSNDFDPHTWLDPVLAREMTDLISQKLQKIDPDNADIYQPNTLRLKNKFSQLDQDFQQSLSNCTNKQAIVSHDAFGQLAKRYDFTLYPIAGLSTEDQPSTHTMAELKNLANQGITYILTEESNITRFAETLAAETSLKMISINPLGRGTLSDNKDFFDVMYDNLEALKTAFNCL